MNYTWTLRRKFLFCWSCSRLFQVLIKQIRVGGDSWYKEKLSLLLPNCYLFSNLVDHQQRITKSHWLKMNGALKKYLCCDLWHANVGKQEAINLRIRSFCNREIKRRRETQLINYPPFDISCTFSISHLLLHWPFSAAKCNCSAYKPFAACLCICHMWSCSGWITSSSREKQRAIDCML